MLGTARYLTLQAARQIMSAAEAEAQRNRWNVAIAIVDETGNLILFQKMDDTLPGAAPIAIGKARTAANFRRPTKALEDAVSAGRTAFLAIEGLVPMQGGVPIAVENRVIGAIGVSGATSPQDEQIALAGASADFTSPA